MKNTFRRWIALVLTVIWTVGFLAVPEAGERGIGKIRAFADNQWIFTDKIPSGKTGKSMTVSFRLRNNSGHDIKRLGIRFDTNGVDIGDEDEDDLKYGYAFPFETTDSTFEKVKSVGSLNDRKEKTVSLTGRVRRDLQNGYYTVPISVFEQVDSSQDDGGWVELTSENVRVWISVSTSSTDDDDDETKTYDFVLGEGQSTPYGTYPNVLNFSINLRNNSPATVYNVKASIILDADSAKFPFRINDVNYDRMFEKIGVDEVVPLDYSFAIRQDSYTGYYPIQMKIYYSKSSTGEELQTFETTFFVHITSKPKEDEQNDFNEHDRTKARLIVDGFSTDPEKITAGESFDLTLQIKNASGSVSASDVLLTVESEKASDSPVFTTAEGSSSVAISSLPAGGTQTVKFRLSSRAGVDQRSYALTIKAKYDSPEYKNAEDSMSVDLPVYQIPRLNTGTFEVMPDSISVGEESNVMFGINNTGRVTLYNVMATFEADSIQKTDAYVGNIKSGETGNVDCMLTGIAPTMDDGKIKVTISYEDENGNVSAVEKELSLTVTEDFSSMDDPMNQEPMEPIEEPPTGILGILTQHWIVLVVATVIVLGILVTVIGRRLWKKRRKQHQEADEDESEE